MRLEGVRGFTFFELLALLGLLAALVIIAWGKFNASYEESVRTTLISDLRNLATAQEIYYRNNLTYASELHLLEIEPGATSQIEIGSADSSGWSAWNTLGSALTRCEVYEGDGHAATLGIATSPEQISCEDP
ncbi:MAG: hypothetical protein GWN32_00815 [Gemmatimonadetes bacterium]|nr:hypothetical protein [Gemmatimonadota bacterium]